ncbi:MAG: c-type cytochrome [Nitrospinaceae bacterium]|nr:c-type cytochrome [Nitrospinaceae bacterium]NIR53531.1 c-type cytochrome [Nitrospinaceae bacterium]NIS83932.1 c-type cytochrome [Nitrospinaceae bacterium]NIT80741.1 c-type cytochrome [Nitrospinaceae bacterium]NIU43047.1 c-type cytochrome [Nitrospinaceae bacterium]
MKRFLLTVAAMILSGSLAACGQDSEPDQPSPPPAPAPSPASPAAAVHPVTPETRNTYQFYCAQCHGIEGKGNGINAPYLTVPPRDHTKADYLETRTDEHLFTAIAQGGLAVGRAPCMPSWQHTLDEEMIHSLVRYIRELCACESL